MNEWQAPREIKLNPLRK